MTRPAPSEVPDSTGETDSRAEGPHGLEVLQAGGGHGLGNALFLDRAAGALLKVYRSRRGRSEAWREALRDVGHRVFEGKRGVSPAARAATEKETLLLWARHGFDVPALIDRPIPTEVTDPALWIEFCPGETLDRALSAEGSAAPAFGERIARLAVDHARRHALALAEGEILLVQEHPTIVHTLVSGDRLVTIDFENAYASRTSVATAIARELAGTLRSFFRRLEGGESEGRAAFEAFLAAYPEREILAAAVARATSGGGFAARLRRRRDRGRRNRPSKVEVMQWAGEWLAGGD